MRVPANSDLTRPPPPQYWPFRKKYGPALAFTEALMKARDDLDRSAVNEIMESVRRKVAREKLDEPDPPSIFDRLPPK